MSKSMTCFLVTRMYPSVPHGDSWLISLVCKGSRPYTKKMAHQDWYQQRYGSAQAHKRRRQMQAAKAAHYEEIKELRQERRETS